MSYRPRPRPQEGGLWYHVGARGVRKLPIVQDDDDRSIFLTHLAEIVALFGWELTAFCLMTNHYHLVLRTPEPNIATGMHRLNFIYARAFNKKHGYEGHLFDARYWSGVLATEDSLFEALRYVVLNPVRAGLCQKPSEWPWSSYRQTVGLEPPAKYLSLDWLDLFDTDRRRAQLLFRGFVDEGTDRPPDTKA
jgi:REP-associated tyrosine transposase